MLLSALSAQLHDLQNLRVKNAHSDYHQSGARPRGRTATQRFEKGSEKALGRVLVLGKGSGEGFWGRVLGSQKRF